MPPLCLHVYIIFCYGSKIWLFVLYGSSCYHSNKNGCFSCSKHESFLLLWGKTSAVSVVPVPSRDLLEEAFAKNDSHPSCAYWSEMNWMEYDWIDVPKKIVEDKTDSLLWQGFTKLLKILIGNETMATFMEEAAMRVSIFLLIQRWHS